MPGQIGLYLAMTGERLNAADCLYTGLATHFVPHANIHALLTELGDVDVSDHKAIDDIISRHAARCPMQSRVQKLQPLIDRAFAPGVCVEEILLRLRQEGTKWSLDTLYDLRKKCPFSLKGK